MGTLIVNGEVVRGSGQKAVGRQQPVDDRFPGQGVKLDGQSVVSGSVGTPVSNEPSCFSKCWGRVYQRLPS
jgi:hypothetical protein